jgi:aspartyl-tRNA(Asn)/glutamyl-tRNA(Gln) amidotransferase subunit B
MKNVKTATNNYGLVCGMEIHAELKTQSKMFCGCKNDPFGAPEPNIYTCPVCLGMPGGLPVANKKAIEWTIKIGLALGCKINLFSKFDRKNYFYPDLPKSYQISQYDIPFCYDGKVNTSHGEVKITRIHLEEDTGKLLHKKVNGENVSLIDFNRSSVPLVEIVSEPDIHSPEQAKEYAKKIRDILRYLDVADCDMEQGGMRLEANISLAKNSLDESRENKLPNYKVEVKNINSFRFAQQAIKYEMSRQAKILDSGKTPIQETRGYDSVGNRTFSQRTKEDAQDYRYFPDPDLPPIRFTKEEIEKIRLEVPELPEEIIDRWQSELGVDSKYSSLLIDSESTARILEEALLLVQETKYQPNDLANALANKKLSIELHKDNAHKISSKQIIEEFLNMTAVDDVSDEEIIQAVKKIIADNQNAVDRYRSGQKQVLGFFIGQTLKEINKKVDTKKITNLIIKELK